MKPSTAIDFSALKAYFFKFYEEVAEKPLPFRVVRRLEMLVYEAFHVSGDVAQTVVELFEFFL